MAKQQDEISKLILEMRQQQDIKNFLYSENYLNKEERDKELIKTVYICFDKIKEVKNNYSKQPTDSVSGGE